MIDAPTLFGVVPGRPGVAEKMHRTRSVLSRPRHGGRVGGDDLTRNLHLLPPGSGRGYQTAVHLEMDRGSECRPMAQRHVAGDAGE